jgi:hypothetical protein
VDRKGRLRIERGRLRLDKLVDFRPGFGLRMNGLSLLKLYSTNAVWFGIPV